MVKLLGSVAGRLHTGHQVAMWEISVSVETPRSASSPPMHTAPLMTRKAEHKSAQFLTDISTQVDYFSLLGS